jgi:hypothetical protein
VPARITRIDFSTATRSVISINDVARTLGTRLDRIKNLIQQEKTILLILDGSKYFCVSRLKRLIVSWTMA